MAAEIPSLFDLHGKVALVTGAGHGLGRTLAVALATAGADVALAGRTPATLAEAATEVGALGRRGTVHLADVSQIGSLAGLVDAVVRGHHHLDILVNNAGIKVPELAVDVSENAWDQVLGVNLKGAFFLAQSAARHMLGRGSGKIINIASTYAVVAAHGRTTYAISKGGLLQLTRSMAVELAGHGINVNAVGPTSVETPMNVGLFADEEWRRMALARIPAGRFCTPEDVAGPVVFLASAAADMIHGQLLLVDGGLTAL